MKIFAPFAGIVRYAVAEGDTVATGDIVAVVEATKLDAPIQAPGPGRISAVICDNFADVVGGDVLLELEA